MKTQLILALLIAGAFAPLATGADTVTVRLQVTAGSVLAPGIHDCNVTVPAGAHVGDVLDAAAAQGCISSWSYDSYPGFGRYVTCIDGVCEQLGTYWSFWVDGGYAGGGIDDTTATNGATYSFVYDQYLTYFLPL